MFFWIAASAADILADNPSEIKTFSSNEVSTLFINGTPAAANGLRKLRNPPSWVLISVEVPFDSIPLFSKDLFTFIISFISLFVRVISEPVVD